jgi:bla regulator protein BlaR1
MLPGLILSAAALRAQPGVKTNLQFDVVSIKLDHSTEERGLLQIPSGGDRVIVTNVPMFRIVELAYNFQRKDLVLGAPEWAFTERWDIEAKVANADLEAFHALTFAQQESMLQSVLMSRCGLQAQVVKTEVPVYALVVAKSGLKMHEVSPSEAPPVVHDANGKVVEDWDLTHRRGEIHGRFVPMEALLYALSDGSLGRQVIDRTGLKGRYNFDLLWTPDDQSDSQSKDAGLSAEPLPSIFTAAEEQLGLRFDRSRASVDAISIRHLERPTDN